MTTRTVVPLALLVAGGALLAWAAPARAGGFGVSTTTVIHRPVTRTVVVTAPAEPCVVVPRRTVVIRRPAIRYVPRYHVVRRPHWGRRGHYRLHRRCRYVRTVRHRPRVGISVRVVLP